MRAGSLSMASTTTGPTSASRVHLAEEGEGREQARDADGETGGRHLLAPEAGDEAVIAPPADTEPKRTGRPVSSAISKVSSAS